MSHITLAYTCVLLVMLSSAFIYELKFSRCVHLYDTISAFSASGTMSGRIFLLCSGLFVGFALILFGSHHVGVASERPYLKNFHSSKSCCRIRTGCFRVKFGLDLLLKGLIITASGSIMMVGIFPTVPSLDLRGVSQETLDFCGISNSTDVLAPTANPDFSPFWHESFVSIFIFVMLIIQLVDQIWLPRSFGQTLDLRKHGVGVNDFTWSPLTFYFWSRFAYTLACLVPIVIFIFLMEDVGKAASVWSEALALSSLSAYPVLAWRHKHSYEDGDDDSSDEEGQIKEIDSNEDEKISKNGRATLSSVVSVNDQEKNQLKNERSRLIDPYRHNKIPQESY